MTTNPTLVILLAAGASKFFDIPITPSVSGLIDRFLATAFPEIHDAITHTHMAALGRRGTFEDDVNSIETLAALLSTTSDAYIAAVAPLIELIPSFKARLTSDRVLDALDKTLQKIDETFRDAQNAVRAIEVGLGADFLMQLAQHFTLKIYTLNYDTTLDQMVSARWDVNDGYLASANDVGLFNGRHFLTGPGMRVGHLHGSIDFGFLEGIDATITTVGLVKLLTGIVPPRPLSSYQLFRTMAGELLVHSKIVTGLRKLEKVNVEPYMTYSLAFNNDLLTAQRLLIIGYGAGDPYIDAQIDRAIRYDATNWRSALITLDPPTHASNLGVLCALLAGEVSGARVEPVCTAIAAAKTLTPFCIGSLTIATGGWRPGDPDQLAGIVSGLT